jgi:hypothetical protein
VILAAERERMYVRQAWENHLRSCAVCYAARDEQGLCIKGREISADVVATMEVETGGVGFEGAAPVEIVRDDVTDKYRTPRFVVRGAL